ncbi:MAG: hydantoinase/oxoprolinase family protein [Thermoleophilaceae bacterium]
MVLGVDVGGTFTDAALLTPTGLFTGKAPTTTDDQSAGVMSAVGDALDAAGAGARDVERLVHGMTVGTNALLEGRIARTALVATEGFTDLEELGRQARPELYRLCVGGPQPVVPAGRRVAAPERTGPGGVLRELDVKELELRLQELPDDVEAVAVCLLWGFRHPEHEQAVAEVVARTAPHAHVSASHEVAGVFREYERLVTTVIDAALSPLLRSYLARLTERTKEAGLPEPQVMLSSGGVASAATAAQHGSWTVLSGPAGGAVAAARAALRAGAREAVAFDMGGTSCDVSLVTGGRVAVTGGREVGGRPLALPMVDVHTVGAGGGSVAWRDAGGALRVGPRSAGAQPGPACYGHGATEPTVTDANLVLGLLSAESPLAGGVTLDQEAARGALESLAGSLGLEPEEAAAGVLRVASAEMAQAARVVTVERGIDPRTMTLVAFGGAGPLHATAVAEELGMRRVVVPVVSGVLSALGLAVSERRRDLVESVLLSGAELTREAAGAAVHRLASRGLEEIGSEDAEVRATYELRYAGQAFELPIDAERDPDPSALREAFDEAHLERYGYEDPEADLELVTVRVAVALPGAAPAEARVREAPRRGRRPVRFAGQWHETPVFGHGDVEIRGPAIVELPGSTLAVPPGWSGTADAEAVVIGR